jgi:hypothetical protein
MTKGGKIVVPDYTTVKKLPKTFKELVDERRDLAADIKVLEARFDELGDEILPYMIAARVKSVMVGEQPVTVCEGRRATIDAMILLQNGVGSDVIQMATKVSTYTYVTTGKAVTGAE